MAIWEGGPQGRSGRGRAALAGYGPGGQSKRVVMEEGSGGRSGKPVSEGGPGSMATRQGGLGGSINAVGFGRAVSRSSCVDSLPSISLQATEEFLNLIWVNPPGVYSMGFPPGESPQGFPRDIPPLPPRRPI